MGGFMRITILALLGAFLIITMHTCIAQINGPENVFVTGPRELNYEIVNDSLDSRAVELSIYCPRELHCELVNKPLQLEAGESSQFIVSFDPYENAISKRYIVTILARLGNELLKKEVEVTVGILGKLEEADAEEELQASEGPTSFMPAVLIQEPALLNVLLAVIAVILFLLLIIKIREFKR
jgi:hypothetical protein